MRGYFSSRTHPSRRERCYRQQLIKALLKLVPIARLLFSPSNRQEFCKALFKVVLRTRRCLDSMRKSTAFHSTRQGCFYWWRRRFSIPTMQYPDLRRCQYFTHHPEKRRHAMNVLSLYWRAEGASLYSVTGCPPLSSQGPCLVERWPHLARVETSHFMGIANARCTALRFVGKRGAPLSEGSPFLYQYVSAR